MLNIGAKLEAYLVLDFVLNVVFLCDAQTVIKICLLYKLQCTVN